MQYKTITFKQWLWHRTCRNVIKNFGIRIGIALPKKVLYIAQYYMLYIIYIVQYYILYIICDWKGKKIAQACIQLFSCINLIYRSWWWSRKTTPAPWGTTWRLTARTWWGLSTGWRIGRQHQFLSFIQSFLPDQVQNLIKIKRNVLKLSAKTRGKDNIFAGET